MALLIVVLTATLAVGQPSTLASVRSPHGATEPVDSRTDTPAQTRPCGHQIEKSAASSSSQDGGARRTLTLSNADCRIRLRIEGKVTFNAAFTDVQSLSSGGVWRLDVTEGGVRRELELRASRNSLERTFRMNGREEAFDAAAAAWLSGVLVTLDRRLALGVDTRLPLLLQQGGMKAVLRETALMAGDFARSEYYKAILATNGLTDPERALVLAQAASLTTSDDYASELVSAMGTQGFEDASVRAAALEMIDRMKSDHFRMVAVKNVAGARRPTAAEMTVLVWTIERLESDSYKLELLKQIVKSPLDARHRAALTRAAHTVKGDDSRNDALQTMLALPGLNESELLGLVTFAVTIDDDRYKHESLLAIALHSGVTDRVRTAILAASEHLSADHREQVRRAAGKRPSP